MHSLLKAAAASVVLVACLAIEGSAGSSCVEGHSMGRDGVQWARRSRDRAELMHDYKRPKRAKYYGGGGGPPGWALHRPAPRAPPFYSHTPPPDYMFDDENSPASFAPSASPVFKLGLLSKKPAAGPETLVDADIANLVRSLSKNDLDRIIEYAGEKSGRPYIRNAIDGPAEYDGDDHRRPSRGRPGRPAGAGPRSPVGSPYVPDGAPSPSHAYGNSELGAGMVADRDPLLFVTDRYREEEFPNVSSFRDDSADFDISYTKNIESVIKPVADYKLGNFGELPLMNEESKTKSIDSYNVAHYTVTSISSPPESKKSDSGERGAGAEPKFEAAPAAGAAAAARAHSDAHLKAVKIWTHHSVGAAYTVHDDGSLSPEKPLLRKPATYS
ncbi:hypothetical protein EVAR_25504_1 [Eumeta japonica]|uniref:Uncharacterized protein n=1 Tax=Eumeta variegata TaxID=151549 RepID=A0A4C1VMD0_EUMVA|nr:hypothetical protein EVAR_25504_1 [Eumeta japonica]